MAGGAGNTENGEPEFQIAPMIDVLLVMLIFFMSITSAQVLRIDKDINLPVAVNAKKKENKKQALEATINVRMEGSTDHAIVKLEDQELSEDEIIERLQERKEEHADYRVVIRGDRNVPAIEIGKITAMISQAGINDISFSTLNQD